MPIKNNKITMEFLKKASKEKDLRKNSDQLPNAEKESPVPSLKSLRKINKSLLSGLAVLSAGLVLTTGNADTAHSAETVSSKLSLPPNNISKPTDKIPSNWVTVNNSGKITIKNPNKRQSSINKLPTIKTSPNAHLLNSNSKIHLNTNYTPLKQVSNNFSTPSINNPLDTPINRNELGTPSNQKFPSNVHIGPNQNISPNQITADPTSEVSIGGFQEIN